MISDGSVVSARASVPVPDPFMPVDYILSPCTYTALGLSGLLQETARPVCLPDAGILPGAPEPLLGRLREGDRIVVFLPFDPLQIMMTLKHLILLTQGIRGPVNILILSRLDPVWLYLTLKHLMPGRRRLSAVRIAVPGMPRISLFRALRGEEVLPLLETLARRAGAVSASGQKGLTLRELDAMLALFDGNDIKTRSLQLSTSAKTLYHQKMSGLRKLAPLFPVAAALLPGRQRRMVPPQRSSLYETFKVSPDEEQFASAIRQGAVFPVFQPVFSAGIQVVGFELLSRWKQDGRILTPSEFLPAVHSREAWILLTAYCMRIAVARINQFRGLYWFAVNIPAGLAESPALLRMLAVARSQLDNPAWQDALVLEFSEKTDLSKGAKAVEILRQLRRQGARVFLDDCFSENSVMFPIRQVRFSGYKLDMSVVTSFLTDAEDRKLIEGLVHYCQLTGRECVAEGVDTAEKFTALKNIGITAFQGYYLSRPVPGEELETLVSSFNPA